MATIEELFKSKKKEVYGTVGKSIIDSRGLINPPRKTALLASSPKAVADLIGNQIGGILKGSANRPSDTIFKNNNNFSKPITLNPLVGVKEAVEAGQSYYVKKSPAPDSLIANLKQGASKLTGALFNESKKRLPDATKKYREKLLKKLNKKEEPIETPPPAIDPNFEYYRTSKFEVNKAGKAENDIRNFTGYVRDKNGKLNKRDADTTIYSNGKGKFDLINEKISLTPFYDAGLKFEDFINKPEYKSEAKQTILILEPYGKKHSIVLPAVISGISEDISPEWDSFKFLGSPFNTYKLTGVERSIKFDLKMYYNTVDEKDIMIMKLNSIKELAFPNDEITAVTYQNEDNYTQLAFGPNFVYLTIGGLYKRILGAVDSLSIAIEDNIVWQNDINNEPYPSVINVSFSMKVIENHTIKKGKTTTRYAYDFDGLGDGTQKKKGIGTIGTAMDEDTFK
jgi:hypothetical protein